jgi:hypothetical protein
MAESEVSISGALSFAWSFLSHNWRSIWGVLALNALSWTVLYAGLFANQPALDLAGALAFLVTNYPVYGAVFRIARKAGDKEPDSQPGAHGIQWRGMELRMLIADLLVFVFQLILGVLILFALLSPFAAMAFPYVAKLKGVATQADLQRILGPAGAQAIQLIPLVVWAVLLFVRMRLFLALPASGLGGRVAVFRTWKLTKGRFLSIFLAYFVVQTPMMVTTAVLSAALSGQIDTLTPVQIFTYSILSGVLAGAASTPLTAALQAYFYQGLGPVPEPPSVSKAESR